LLLLLLQLMLLVSPSFSTHQQDYESLFLEVPSAARAYEHLAYYTSFPHLAGTREGYTMAVFTKERLESYGLNAHIEEEDVFLSYPVSRSLEITYPPNLRYKAVLQETYYPIDPTSGDPRIVPTFNSYSASGQVSAPVIYVNYGTLEDYRTLDQLGVRTDGMIHLARYGGIFRGTKVMLAQKWNASAVIIYSDPIDDGVSRGTVFPKGPFRPEHGVQRGSATFLSLCPGDPTIPACQPSKTHPRHLHPRYGKNVRSDETVPLSPQIPVLPISYGDAQFFLKGLSGPQAPPSWQGGLNFTYRTGPGPVIANLKIEMNNTRAKIWNVIAKIQGTEQPERQVLLGNHRDAWVFGAVDPNSGSSAFLEVARGYGKLLSVGWKPKRSLVLASWDAEEYGLIGSTAYSIRHADTLTKSAVAYLNVDVGVFGPTFFASSSPSLRSAIIEATRLIIDPATKKPLYDLWNHETAVLGSGSDYTSFLDNLGIPSLDMSFGSDIYGVYHSAYDSLYWMKNFGDPEFVYHKAIAQLWGLLGLRFADSEVIPLNFTDYGDDLENYFSTLLNLIRSNDGSDQVDVQPLYEAISDFKSATSVPITSNDVLLLAERQLLGPGLPSRPFFKHLIQAPGIYLGYGSDTFPGVSQSVRDHDWELAQNQIAILSGAIAKAAEFLRQETKPTSPFF